MGINLKFLNPKSKIQNPFILKRQFLRLLPIGLLRIASGKIPSFSSIDLVSQTLLRMVQDLSLNRLGLLAKELIPWRNE
jgi:hypothetical protein